MPRRVASRPFAVRPAGVADLPQIADHRAAMFRDMGALASGQEESLKQSS
jgi:hypothetical protein